MEIPTAYKTLSLTANRALAAMLIESELVSVDDIDRANDQILAFIESGNLRQVSIINILAYELKVLDEADYISYVTEKLQFPLINLHNYNIRKFDDEGSNPDRCIATWSVPFDQVGDYTMVASTYCPAKAVIRHWEEILPTRILWYATSQSSISEALERVSRGKTTD